MSDIVRLLSSETGLSILEVRRIIHSAPIRYKDYSIPKKNGDPRPISQPAREVKMLQRAFCKLVLEKLPVHRCAMAYKSGSSILENAIVHAGDGPVLKMDFENFFPSIQKHDWVRYCRKTGCITDETDISLSSQLLFRKAKGDRYLRMAIGAPSSPMLSNILMFEFDEIISEAVSKDKVRYTRYADDLTFSAPRTGHLTGVIKTVKRTLRDLTTPKLRINERKTVHATRKYHRGVTGLTLSNDGRVTIGKKKKRHLHAAVYSALNGKLNDENLQSLCGQLAFVNSVEPEFIDVLRRRYGPEIIKVIQNQIRQKN